MGASSASGQTGGTPPAATEPAPSLEPSASTSGSWTVYKKATWYGPGFWGNHRLREDLDPTTIGVAHKKLPCGTKVSFCTTASASAPR